MEHKLTALSNEKRDSIKSGTGFDLPDNPSEQGWSASQIKRKFYAGILELTDFVRTLVDEINANYEIDDTQFASINSSLDIISQSLSSLSTSQSNIESSFATINSEFNKISQTFQSLKQNTETSISDFGDELDLLAERVNGVTGAYVSNDYNSLAQKLVDDGNAKSYRKGQTFYIVELNVPDVWIASNSETEEHTLPEDYETWEDYIKFALKGENGGVAYIGYYSIACMETNKVDLTNLATKEYVDSKDAIPTLTSSTVVIYDLPAGIYRLSGVNVLQYGSTVQKLYLNSASNCFLTVGQGRDKYSDRKFWSLDCVEQEYSYSGITYSATNGIYRQGYPQSIVESVNGNKATIVDIYAPTTRPNTIDEMDGQVASYYNGSASWSFVKPYSYSSVAVNIVDGTANIILPFGSARMYIGDVVAQIMPTNDTIDTYIENNVSFSDETLTTVSTGFQITFTADTDCQVKVNILLQPTIKKTV